MTERARVHVAQVGAKSQKEKHRAQNILSFRDPGDGLNPQRMNREKRGDKSAAPKPAGDVAQPKEK